MNNFLVFVLFLTSWLPSVFAQNRTSETLIVLAIQSPQFRSPLIRIGFYDSPFDYSDSNGLTPKNKSMCYVGKVSEVCGLIRQAEKDMNQNYRQGDHDRIDILSCKVVAGATVEVRYELRDDYGSYFKIERELKACMN